MTPRWPACTSSPATDGEGPSPVLTTAKHPAVEARAGHLGPGGGGRPRGYTGGRTKRHGRKRVGGLVDVVEGNAAPEEETSADHGAPGAKRLPRSIEVPLTVLGFGLPVAGYLWLISAFSVNAIYQDQWSDVTVVQRTSSHLFDWGLLWSQHNEDRIFFPNLVVVALARTTKLNITGEELLSATMLFVATGLLIWAHKRRSPAIPWLYYCPVAILACSVVQFGATLWGFQMAWYLVLVAMATTVVLIDRVDLTWWAWTAAAVVAVVGSFSSLQGLLIWPVGLVLLCCRRRSGRFVIAWSAAAVATVAIYLYDFNVSAGLDFPKSLTGHAISPVTFAVFAVGDVLGVPIPFGGHDDAVLALGTVIVLLAVAVAVTFGIRRDEHSGTPVGIALICFGLLFAGLVARGRAPLGYWAASSSGYTIYDVWILGGVYLALLGRSPLAGAAPRPDRPAGRPGADGGRHPDRTPGWPGSTVVSAARWLVIAVIVLQVVVGIPHGIDGARTIHAAEVRAASTARGIDHATDLQVLDDLNFSKPPAFTRQQVRVARELHLSLFAGSGGGS